MSRSRQQEEPKSNDVPAWVVSYSDMVTLLLSFFVMMMAFASRQDPELFFIGQGSFRRAIAGWGVPNWLEGREFSVRFDHRRNRYPVEEDPEQKNDVEPRNVKDQKLREEFNRLQQVIDSMVSEASGTQLTVRATAVRFARGQTALDPEGREELETIARELRESLGGRKIQLYVVGFAADEESREAQWTHSALRADSAALELRTLLATQRRRDGWTVLSWGDGPGGQWRRRNGIQPESTDIVIVVVEDGGRRGG